MPNDAPEQPRWMASGPLYIAMDSADREGGILHGVAITTAGEAKGHGVWLDQEFVNDTVTLGNEKKHGVKVRFGHPNMSSTALGTFLGRAKNFRADGDIARADVFLSNEAKETPNGNLHDYILGMAENEPDMLGNSIVFTPGKTYRRDKDGNKAYRHIRETQHGWDVWYTDEAGKELSKEAEGELSKELYTEIAKLHASDVVDSPAANPDGMFSAWSADMLAGQATEFLDTHPEFLELLRQKPEVVEMFLSRYDEYLQRRSPTDMETKEATPAAEAIEAPVTETTTELDTIPAPVLTAEPVTEAPATTEPDPRAEFQAMLTEFGPEVAAAAFAEGGGIGRCRELKLESLEAENKALRKAAEQPAGETAVPFQAEESDTSGPNIEALKAANGSSQGVRAMAAVIRKERMSAQK